MPSVLVCENLLHRSMELSKMAGDGCHCMANISNWHTIIRPSHKTILGGFNENKI